MIRTGVFTGAYVMIAGLMQFTNTLSERYRTDRWRTRPFQESIEVLLRLMAPSAPFVAEELRQQTEHQGSVHHQPWPEWNEHLARESTMTIVVQVNGRVRDRFEIGVDSAPEVVQSEALARPKVRQYVPDPSAAQVIYVPGRIVNVVTRY